MAPQEPTTLRAILAYAGNLLSQSPLLSGPFNNIPNPLAHLLGGTQQQQQHVAPSYYEPLSAAPSCPIDGPTSCRNSTPPSGDSCCFVHPGGRLLLTQFWDSQAHQPGAEEDWTIHGLWYEPPPPPPCPSFFLTVSTFYDTERLTPSRGCTRPDLCDGTYDSFCSMSPRYSDIPALLASHGQDDLLSFMHRYWPSAPGSTNAHFWAHEWNKHGTCINTLSPSCYGGGDDGDRTDGSNSAYYRPGAEAVDYFSRAAALFRTLDTYTALERAGVAPHATRRYPLADVRAALERFSGGRVVLRCSGGGRRDVLHEVWYVYFVKGSLQTGEFVPAQDLGEKGDAGNCAPWVRYLPKKGASG